MSSPGTILITGPIRGLKEYCGAAREADWTPIERPLLAIREVEARLALETGIAIEHILITSSNAIASLDRLASTHIELRELPCAAVGERTARVLRETGFTVEGEPARDASELAKAMADELPPSSTLLWPRGSVSDQLAVDLRGLGHRVLDPIAYETSPHPNRESTPDAALVFFASPSAVQAWSELAHERPNARTAAIAIGATTEAALSAQTAEPFSAILTLSQPAPEELTRHLRELSNAQS